jgi:hypothetical protein
VSLPLNEAIAKSIEAARLLKELEAAAKLEGIAYQKCADAPDSMLEARQEAWFMACDHVRNVRAKIWQYLRENAGVQMEVSG